MCVYVTRKPNMYARAWSLKFMLYAIIKIFRCFDVFRNKILFDMVYLRVHRVDDLFIFPLKLYTV